MQYRVRFVSDGGPVRKDNSRGWPATCGHKHHSQATAVKCLAKQRDTICETKPLGAALQFRLFSGHPWQWIETKDE